MADVELRFDPAPKPPPLLQVVVNDERYVPERSLIEALARAYNAGSRESVTIADLCDDYLDPSGRLLGKVRVAALEARR